MPQAVPHSLQTTNLADILERVLDKGIVIAGDIKICLADIELLNIKIRLLVASAGKAWEEDMAERKGGSGFGLGDLFKGIGDLVELLKEMEAEGKTETTRTGELRGKGRLKDLKGVYGFSVKVGLGGEPTVETFGNIKKGEEGAVVEEIREPLVDIFDEHETIRVIAELPGVDAGDITVEMKDR